MNFFAGSAPYDTGATRNTLSLEFTLFWNLYACVKTTVNKGLNTYKQTQFTRWNWQETNFYKDDMLELASADGCQEIVETLINTENFSIYDYQYALESASYHGHVEVVQLLLLQDGVASTNNGLNGPLYFSQKNGHTKCAELLKRYGAESISGLPL